MNERLIRSLKKEPVKYAHILGFDLLTDFHNDWIRMMAFGKEDATLLGHRGSYKTTCLSFSFALIIVLMPDKSILFFRKTDDDVVEVIKQTAKILDSDLFRYIVQEIYGISLSIKATAFRINTNLNVGTLGRPQLQGQGIKGSMTGKHADIVCTDDIVNVKDRQSRPEREFIRMQYMELQNIKNRDGRILNTGTPWHKDDAVSLMPNVIKFDCYHTGLISSEKLQELKNSMAPSLFAANYELRHIASESVIFSDPRLGADPSLCEQGTMHLDSAFHGDDYTAWSVMKKHDGKYYLYGQIFRKHVNECYDMIMHDYERFKCGKLWNEDNADKGMVADELKRLGARTVTYHEQQNKYIKIVTHLKRIWGDLYFVEGTGEDYISQILEYYEDADHDDAPDSAASLARLLYKKRTDDNLIWN